MTSNRNLLETLNSSSRLSSITFEEITIGVLDNWIDAGLQLMILCEYGVRSGNTAYYLSIGGLPTVFLKGGLVGLRDNHLNSQHIEQVTNSIHRVPHIAITLSKEEKDRHQALIHRVTGKSLQTGEFYTPEFEEGKALWFSTITHAIPAISRMSFNSAQPILGA